VLEDLLFKPIPQVKDDIISICLNGEREEVDFKFNASVREVLQSQPELSGHDEDFDRLGGHQKLLVRLHEVDDVRVREDDCAIRVEGVVSLVGYEHRYEVHQLHDRLLVVVHLRALDLDKLVADVLSDVQHYFVLEHVVNHLVVFCLEQY